MKLYKYILIVLVPLLFGCEEEEYQISGFDSDILFISRRIENSGQWNLMTMNPDGTGQSKLTNLTVRCSRPVISNTGDKVLFVHYTDSGKYELYSINSDGTNQTLIDSANRYCGSASWSYDDSKIVYSKNRSPDSDNKDLILYDLLTHTKDTLTESGNNFCAAFTPDGKIVYCHETEPQSCDIYKMDMHGSNNHKLISNACKPVLSPNGNKIAYHSTIENGSTQIFVADSDGTNRQQLTSSISPQTWPGWPPDGNHDPNWTPDSRKIVYVSWGDGDPEIHIMNSDGSNKRKLTDTDERDEHPVVFQSGKYILFSSNRNMDMKSEIYIMDIHGNHKKSLTNYKKSDTFPVEMK